MAGVFISYRREDSPGHAGRVFDRVRARFGGDVVFMDVTAIDAGVDFVEEIERAVGTCDVLLAVIGPQWGSATDGAGRKRLDSPTDFVRVEIGGALKRNVRVVPVLVDGAQLPSASDLPDDLQPLLRRNAIELRDARWDADIDQLIASLERIVTAPVGPLRLERKASGHLRWLAALAMLVLAVGATAVFGPRACAPGSGGGSTATTTAPPAAPQNASAAPAPVEPRPRPTTPTTPPRERPAPASRGVTTPTATATVPDVVGKPLSDAREVLRRAGVDVARILYRDDRLKAVDLVVAQSEARTLAGRPPAVDLTAVARAAVIIHYTPEDADVARALLGALMTVPVPAGTAFHARELSTIRPETVSRVTYSDADLTEAGVEIAKAATAWLRQNEPDRRGFAAMRHPPVAPRTILIGVPERGTKVEATAALPDVRGLELAEARRRLTASGRVTLSYKWFEDRTRTPLVVVSQTELPAATPGTRSVVLDVVWRGTLFIDYVERDRPAAGRLASELRGKLSEGMLVRLRAVDAVRPDTLGRVVASEESLAGEAATIARFATGWLAKESGRTARIPVVTERLFAPRIIVFGFPSP